MESFGGFDTALQLQWLTYDGIQIVCVSAERDCKDHSPRGHSTLW